MHILEELREHNVLRRHQFVFVEFLSLDVDVVAMHLAPWVKVVQLEPELRLVPVRRRAEKNL